MFAVLVHAAICIMLVWVLWWLALAGVGIGFARACGRRLRTGDELLGAFWTGLALTLVFLMFWHFLFPVNRWAAACVLGAGALGLATGWKRLRRAWRGWSPRLALGLALFFVLMVWVADHSLEESYHYDSGLYHFPSIHWISTYPLVPGLGLLHGRLAFNQTHFLLVSMLDAGPFGRFASHWVTGLILLPLLARLLLRLLRRPRPGESPVPRLFWTMLAVPALLQTNAMVNIASPSPDLPVAVISFAMAMEFLDLIMLPPAAKRGLRGRVLRIVLVCLAGVTMKLNFLVMGFGMAGLALALAIYRLSTSASRKSSPSPSPSQSELEFASQSHSQSIPHSTFRIPHSDSCLLTPVSSTPNSAFRIPHSAFALLWRSLALALLIFVPWSARDVVMSGYVAYPLPCLAAPVPWRVPRADVDLERITISSFAKDPFKRQAWPVRGWAWLKDWVLLMVDQYFYETIVPLGMLLVALCLALAQQRMGLAAAWRAEMLLFLAVPCVGVVFWFFVAPHPRFSAGSIWILAAGTDAFMLARFAASRPRLGWSLAALLCLALLYIHGRNWPLITPGSEEGFRPLITGPTHPFKTDSGLILHVPDEGDRCWNAPLPATPYPRKNLRLRVPGDLGKGFVLGK